MIILIVVILNAITEFTNYSHIVLLQNLSLFRPVDTVCHEIFCRDTRQSRSEYQLFWKKD